MTKMAGSARSTTRARACLLDWDKRDRALRARGGGWTGSTAVAVREGTGSRTPWVANVGRGSWWKKMMAGKDETKSEGRCPSERTERA